MDYVEGLVLPYVNLKSAFNMQIVSSSRFFKEKIYVYKIENWYLHLLKQKWIRSVFQKARLPYKKTSVICKLCKRAKITEAVSMNNKLIFSCYACYNCIEGDIISEIYPQLYDPLHISYVCFFKRDDHYFQPIFSDEEWEQPGAPGPCRLQ